MISTRLAILLLILISMTLAGFVSWMVSTLITRRDARLLYRHVSPYERRWMNKKPTPISEELMHMWDKDEGGFPDVNGSTNVETLFYTWLGFYDKTVTNFPTVSNFCNGLLMPDFSPTNFPKVTKSRWGYSLGGGIPIEQVPVVKKFPYVNVLSNVCDSNGVPTPEAWKDFLEKEREK